MTVACPHGGNMGLSIPTEPGFVAGAQSLVYSSCVWLLRGVCFRKPCSPRGELPEIQMMESEMQMYLAENFVLFFPVSVTGEVKGPCVHHIYSPWRGQAGLFLLSVKPETLSFYLIPAGNIG